jgi:antibiotic biosynthesis monooxygenase (ABM) superfamily enzyme
MISRIWHGWTSPGNADAYESLLKEEIFVNIAKRQIKGYESIQLLRRNLAEETEFITIMRFASIEAVKEFAGEKYGKSVVPENARKLLLRFDSNSQHYEVKAETKTG